MRNRVYAICEQQRRRSACASAQSDQRLFVRCLDSIIPLVSITEISSLYVASVAEQSGLSLTWSETPGEDRFSRDEAQILHTFGPALFSYALAINSAVTTVVSAYSAHQRIWVEFKNVGWTKLKFYFYQNEE